MGNGDWHSRLRDLYDTALCRYRDGQRELDGFLSPTEEEMLAEIGYRPIDLFDVVEDRVLAGEPDWGTVLLVASARRDYFLHVQDGRWSSTRQEDFPGGGAQFEGVRWLPRILGKARAKLRGELPDFLMYGCGGDRAFLSRHDLHAGDFLRLVWAAGSDDARVAAYVLSGGVKAVPAPPVPSEAPATDGDACPI